MWRLYKSRGGFALAVIAALVALMSPSLIAQQQPATTPAQTVPKTDPIITPDKAPKDSKDPSTTVSQQSETKRNDRIFGIMPNYSTVNSKGHIEPLTVRDKFKLVAEGSFDPYEFGIVGLVAGKAQLENDDAPWGQGLKGFGKRYAAAFADQAIGNFMTGAVVPSLIHQDPRYFRKGSGGFVRRTEYALSRIIVTRSDSGQREFNYSEFIGNGLAAGIATTYHTESERNLSGVMGTWGTQIAVDALGNFLKEFWPDVRKKLTRHRSPA
jgi:hypothetical protein